MSDTAADAAYIVAALLFIRALAGLSKHETAKAGNGFGIAGMAVALVATIVLAAHNGINALGVVLLIVAVGRRRRDRPVPRAGRRDDRHAGADRAVPQLRRPGGGARRLGRLSSASSSSPSAPRRSASRLLGTYGIHHGEVFIGVFIGAVTFTGSIIAFLKLSARINSKPLMLPGKNWLNIGALVAVRRR